MANKKGSSFMDAVEKGAAIQDQSAPKADPFKTRAGALAESQKVVRTITRLVDPEECALWEHHDRRYDLLDSNNCSDLIHSMIAQGKQEVPAIVRQVRKPKPNEPKYEIIAGARRFWTVQWLRENNYPNFQFLIEIRTLTDEEAFRLSDVENLDREDISDHERAVKYKKALALFYNGKQADMAKRLNRSEGWFSQILRLTELPEEVVNGYGKLADLKVHHAPPILKLLSSAANKRKVLAAARALPAIHQERREAGAEPLKGPAVLKYLVDSAKVAKSSTRAPIAEYGAGRLIAVNSKNQSSIKMTISRGKGTKKTDLVAAFREMLADHLE